MPTISVQMFSGRTVDQKRDFVREVSEAVVRTLGVTPDAVRITIIEIAPENSARAGILHSDRTQ